MPPQMPVLNDDVLRQVADYLLGRDALSFSLTSKHVYDLAIPRVSALIECKDRDKLRALHRTLFYDNPGRAKHIQTLIIRRSAFTLEELYTKRWNDREVLDSPVAPLIVELLRIASNIRSLTIECFETLRASDPGVVAAMAALPRLSRLELFDVQANTQDLFKEEDTEPGIHFLQASGWHLVTLSLECCDYHDHHFYPPLLGTLAAFPRLLTLRLPQFCPRRSFLELDEVHTTPSFPSIQKLFLDETTPPGFDLVGLCPNVSLISIGVTGKFWDPVDFQVHSDENHTMRALGPRWKPLRSLRLTLSSIACMYDAQTLLNTAFHLNVSGEVRSIVQPDGSDAPDMVLLLDTLKKVSPVRAQLSVVVGGEPMHIHARLAEVAPRLRFLELKVTLDSESDDLHGGKYADASWLDTIPDALCALPLVCLRLHLAKMPQYIDLGDDDDGDRHVVGLRIVLREDIKEAYNAGAKTREKLPLRCAGAIRTLKYIAVADEEPSWDDELENANDLGSDGARPRGWESVDEHYGGEADEYEYQSEWYAEKIKTLRWWRVERCVKKRRRKTKLRPLTPEKGRAVQRFLEEADFESIERIDELLS